MERRRRFSISEVMGGGYGDVISAREDVQEHPPTGVEGALQVAGRVYPFFE